jgi:uncharacterized phosphosugar-binding protein
MLSPAARFVGRVQQVIAEITEAELPSIASAADLVVEAVAGDRLVHLFGSGHSQLLALEGFLRAGSLACVNPLIVPELGPGAGLAALRAERDVRWAPRILNRARVDAGDVLIVLSNSGVNAVPVEVARRARDRGVGTVGIVARRYMAAASSTHPAGLKLADVVDVLIDNHGVLGDAVLEVDGAAVPVGPISTIAGAVILHAVLVEAVGRLAARGVTPPVYVSSKLAGADEHNAALVARYQHRVPLLGGETRRKEVKGRSGRERRQRRV